MQIWFHTYGCGYAPPGWSFYSPAYTNRLYVVLGGSAYFQGPDGEVPLKKDHLYLFPHRLPFRAHQDEHNRFNHLFFDFMSTPPLMSETLVELPVQPDTLIGHTVSALILSVLPRGQRSPEDDALVRSYFLNLLRLVLKESGSQALSDPRLIPTLTCIHDHFGESLTDTQLSELAHMEKNHFIRVFRKTIGMTPYQYLRQYRLNRAAALIAAGTTVGEAAMICGFENASSLSHAMKKSRGVSPTQLTGRIDPLSE